jgi:hypothetical protein
MSIFKMAREVLELERELDRLRWIECQHEELQHKYDELLRDSLQHSEKMTFGLLGLLVKPGVADALMGEKA